MRFWNSCSIFIILSISIIQVILSKPHRNNQIVIFEVDKGSRFDRFYELIRNENSIENDESQSESKSIDSNINDNDESESRSENFEEFISRPRRFHRKSRSPTTICERICGKTLSCIRQGKRRCPGYSICACGSLKSIPQPPPLPLETTEVLEANTVILETDS